MDSFVNTAHQSQYNRKTVIELVTNTNGLMEIKAEINALENEVTQNCLSLDIITSLRAVILTLNLRQKLNF